MGENSLAGNPATNACACYSQFEVTITVCYEDRYGAAVIRHATWYVREVIETDSSAKVDRRWMELIGGNVVTAIVKLMRLGT